MARVVSVALHPWLVFAPVVALAAYQATKAPDQWAKWTLMSFSLHIWFPLLCSMPEPSS